MITGSWRLQLDGGVNRSIYALRRIKPLIQAQLDVKMPNLPECYGIIPARYASTRFPGKPLAEIHGRPMFWHVYTRARQCAALTRVLVATDDERIRAAARTLEVETMLTRSDHPSGTDRVLEAAERLQVPHDAIVVNIQGDEPAMDPCMLTELLAPFEDPAVAVTTLASPIDASAAQEPDRVKVVLAANGQALYFSRARIPYPRDPAASAYYGHIGLYAFRMHVLREFVKLPPSRLETSEKLEQLRLLENGIPIRVVLTRHQSIGVDRPEDLARVSRLMASGQC